MDKNKTSMRYVIHSSFWTILDKLFIAIFSLLNVVVFANFVSNTTFGTYQYILTVINLTAIISLSGMSAALIKSVASGYEKSIYLALKTKFRWNIIESLCLFFIAIFYFLNDNSLLSSAFVIAALFSPTKNTLGLYLDFFNGKKNLKTEPSTIY